MDQPSHRDDASPSRLESTTELLAQVRGGDQDALERLLRIYGPLLARWAHGRLPNTARGLSDTEDLVQITLIRVLGKLGTFEEQHPGAFLAYLRRGLLNNLRNEIRHASHRPRGEPPDVDLRAPGPSPLEQTIGVRALEAYEAALEQLTDDQKAAVTLRLEMGCKHEEIASLLGKPSANAARMLVARGLVRLAELIDKESVGDVQW
jgi:RNA polymerase sigma-70 factor, ECF subfamily